MQKIDSKQLRAARSLLGWTQQQLADSANVGLSTLQFFESDKRIPIPNNVTAIVAALEKAGVVFENDGKFVGVKLRVRRGKQ